LCAARVDADTDAWHLRAACANTDADAGLRSRDTDAGTRTADAMITAILDDLELSWEEPPTPTPAPTSGPLSSVATAASSSWTVPAATAVCEAYTGPITVPAVSAAATFGVRYAAARLTAAATPTPVGGDPDVFADQAAVFDPDVFEDRPPRADPDSTVSDVEATCLMNTTTCVNVALSRIGVSKQIVSYASDTNKEAVLARLHWGLDVNRVLRDYPWAFATKYATLTPVIGNESEAANGDWQYGYLVPDDCVMVRRVVPPSGVRRAYDADPVVFRLGTTASGATLFTNQACPVQIEYTYRYECPAAAPDSHFRSALAWRLACSLVTPLARDAKLVDYCEGMYLRELKLAGAGQGNEQQMEKDGDAAWLAGR
jgi:hypothetical protein